ncbi:DeoR/GlpR family DNA-binding transcription regulator [Lactobacillus bombicola]|uniref:DeoR/GlpR transcriptional regulator n=1 Tax=Lactobacillus bombicola TaxID=1505723 RepID=A0A396SV33_9LACO|nr:DeoR/GlpR family DNA-binding transcription regulator [Lactobacillus bombicola]RHW55304.1 DeoR/GlpR transcriptional regulator [Lactobacillus bombicola]
MKLMADRRNNILEEVLKKGTVSVHDLAQKFNVSYETIRKDLTYLESQKLVIKEHGGATSIQNNVENPFNVRSEENIELKQKLVKSAISLIPNGATVMLGTGSTVLELAKLLVMRDDLKIFTNSLPVATYLLSSNNECYLLGGKLRPKSSSVYGGWTENLVKQIQVSICFLGSDGFYNFGGPTSPSYSDASIDSVILQQARKKYILADKTKFKRNSLYQITTWNNITGLVTNKDVNDDLLSEVKQQTVVISA